MKAEAREMLSNKTDYKLEEVFVQLKYELSKVLIFLTWNTSGF